MTRMREHGSEFTLRRWSQGRSSGRGWRPLSQRYSSGRDALRALLRHGQRVYGWRQLWVPSYYCQEVVASLASEIEVAVYRDAPTMPRPVVPESALRSGHVVLWVNYFGLRKSRQGWCTASQRRRAAVIEDHTHDPRGSGAVQSHADWCVASLRKTLPIPDGAVLWSPRGLAVPEAPVVTAESEVASLRKLAAMVIKSLYLDGAPVKKNVFRELFITGERSLGSGSISGMTTWSRELESTIPYDTLEKTRTRNYEVFRRYLGRVPGLELLVPAREACPFCCLIVFDKEESAASVCRALIESDVYPAVLWPLEHRAVVGIPEEHVDLSRRVLSIHCDWRYSEKDMVRVARLVAELAGS